jgi:hypothetical protein
MFVLRCKGSKNLRDTQIKELFSALLCVLALPRLCIAAPQRFMEFIAAEPRL